MMVAGTKPKTPRILSSYNNIFQSHGRWLTIPIAAIQKTIVDRLMTMFGLNHGGIHHVPYGLRNTEDLIMSPSGKAQFGDALAQSCLG